MAVSLEIGLLITLSCPIFGALFALLMLLMDRSGSNGSSKRENRLLIAYFLMVIVNLMQIISLHFNPDVYVWTSAMGLMSYGLMQVFFYGFVFEWTRTDVPEQMHWGHYVAPTVLSVMLLAILSIYGSVEPVIHWINGEAAANQKNYLYIYMGNVYGLKLVFGLVYLVLNGSRLLKYNRFIRNYSSNEEKGSLRWLWFLLSVSVAAMFFPLIWFYMISKMVLSLIPIVCYSLLMFFMYVYLTLHVVRKDRFRVVLTSEIGDSHKTISKKSVLKKDLFEEYILTKKPYLNQDLRITDLVDAFHVNRTYISSFINMEYNMNFSTYINSHRMEEYHRLAKLPENKQYSNQELVERAGFNSYRSFLRIKKEVVKV